MTTVIGIAWYEPDEWADLRSVAPDADKLEATHSEWLALAEQSVRELRRAGYRPYRIPVKVAALQAWCETLGRHPDASSRAEYASAELQRLRQAGLLDADA